MAEKDIVYSLWRHKAVHKRTGATQRTASNIKIGIKATCLSSEYFKAISKRDNKQATIIFEKGKLISYEETAARDSVSGTYIEFIPDKEVFKGMEEGFSFKRICEETKNISFLNKKIHFLVKNLQTNESFDYYSENGIADFIKDKVKNPLMKSPIIVHKTDGTDEVEVAFMWTADPQASYVFANGLSCPQGGSPITAAKRTFTTQIKKLSGRDFDPELIRKGLVYAINCKVREPLFANQTKSSITNKNLGTLTSAALKEGLEDFSRTEDFGAIIEMMTKIQKAENAADKAREAALNRNKKMTELRKQKVAFIDKLSDAEYLGEDSILCLVEGDSGGEAVAVGRDTARYGVMRLKGKMLNGIKEDNDEKYFNNKEIELLIYALGIDVGHYDPKKLRYGKIAICVDSDDDGYHIALLILANLYRLCPQFLQENRVYWLRSPLFIEYDKNMQPMHWFYTNEELADYKAGHVLTGTLDRIKG